LLPSARRLDLAAVRQRSQQLIQQYGKGALKPKGRLFVLNNVRAVPTKRPAL